MMNVFTAGCEILNNSNGSSRTVQCTANKRKLDLIVDDVELLVTEQHSSPSIPRRLGDVCELYEEEQRFRLQTAQFLRLERKKDLPQVYNDKSFDLQFENLHQIRLTLSGSSPSAEKLSGHYEFGGAMNGAGYFERSGSYFGVDGRFVIYKCALSKEQPYTHHWFLSFVAGSAKPGTCSDHNLHHSICVDDSCPVPTSQWLAFTRSSADIWITASAAPCRKSPATKSCETNLKDPTAVSADCWRSPSGTDVSVIARPVRSCSDSEELRAVQSELIQFIRHQRKTFGECASDAAHDAGYHIFLF